MKIAINGMGRIGRLLFKRTQQIEGIDVVAVNDVMSPDNLVYLLKYDSVFGPYDKDIAYKDGVISLNHQKIMAFSKPSPEDLPWKELGIDVVLECTGKFLDLSSASAHLKAGAKKVLLSTTGHENMPLKVYGFHTPDDISDVDVLSPGGCMTNCSTPVIDTLNQVGIQSMMINIIHSYTSRQALVDTAHSQYRRGRAAAQSIIPVDITLKNSLSRLFPGIADHLLASSVRVPVANGAYANFFAELTREISTEELKHLFRESAARKYNGVMQYTDEALVSLDIKGNSHSCVIDGTEVASTGKLVRVSAWFDNEYGFTSRMIDWLKLWETTFA